VTITAIRKMDIDYIRAHFLPVLCQKSYYALELFY